MRNTLTLILVTLLSAMAGATTYKGSYTYSGYAKVSAPNTSTVTLNNTPTSFSHAIEITGVSVTVFPGVFQACTTQPNVQVEVFNISGDSRTITLQIANGSNYSQVTGALEVPSGYAMAIFYTGGAGCSLSITPLELNVEVAYQLETGANGEYFADGSWSTFQINGLEQWGHITFDNPLPDPLTLGFTSYTLMNNAWSFQSCTTIPGEYFSSAGYYSYNTQIALDAVYVEEIIPPGATGPNVSLVYSNTMGTGCTNPTPTGYNETIMYDTDSYDVGPFYASAFFDRQVSSGSYVIAKFPPASVGETYRSFRLSVNGSTYPTNCSTYPSVQISFGTGSRTLTFDGTANDPFWSGTFSVASGSQIRFIYNAGAGCANNNVQFNAIASYSIP